MLDTYVSENIQEVFIRCTHINFHIIACLRAKKALDKFQVSQISGENSLIKRSQMVFEWIENNQSLRDIVRLVMEENEQEHVSNLLQGIRNGRHIPLSTLRYHRLESITPKLMLIIRNDEELIAKLRAKHAISEIDRQDITQASKEYKRNWNLIEAILRRSDYAFDCFEQALRETLQNNAANYLHEGQMIAVHANTTQPEKDEVISELLNNTILEESNDDQPSEEKILRRLNGCNIYPVVAKPGQSIVFFFYCKTVDNLITFTELFISGDLQNMVEVIMNRLLSKIDPEHTDQLKARLSLDNAEILTVEKFSGIADWMPDELDEATSGSRILYSAETQTEHQSEDEDSDDIVFEDMMTSFMPIQMDLFSVPSLRKLPHQRDVDSDFSDKLQSKYNLVPVFVKTIRTDVVENKKKAIRGMTILDKELFVVSESSSKVEVFTSMKLRLSRRWNSKQLIYPMDIGSCKRNKCLYIIDSKGDGQSNEILRLDPNGKLIKNWSTGDDRGYSLSVTDESNVILTVQWKNKLNVYSPDGQLIREINLSSQAGICHPSHAVKLSNGHFVVSFGYYGDDLHRVCTVDADGKIKKSFGRKCGSTIDQMNSPVYLSVDGSGFVMVADRDNGRVLLLDSDLKFKKEILPRERYGLQYPRRILLDETNGRMFVADNEWNNRGILTFKFHK